MLIMSYNWRSDDKALFLRELRLEGKVVVINGEAGSGKTMLLNKIYERLLGQTCIDEKYHLHWNNEVHEIDENGIVKLFVKCLKERTTLSITTQCIDNLNPIIKDNINIIINVE